jgi:hypothetical protein
LCTIHIQTYDASSVAGGFVVSEVNVVMDPRLVNGTWEKGLFFNFTAYFVPGSLASTSLAWSEIMRVAQANAWQLGTSGLYISPFQWTVDNACFASQCHRNGICTPTGPTSYTCVCGLTYKDLDPSNPGRQCQSTKGVNECLLPNDCGENSRCVDDEILYHCECLPRYKDATPKNATRGSICVYDYCSDINFCPANTTCVNEQKKGVCQCLDGFIDIRNIKARVFIGLESKWCLARRDVDECALGLTDCSGVATCTDKLDGYECACPRGFVDGNLQNPGRICSAQLCGLCNGNGDCLHDLATRNVTCQCFDGFAGEYCDQLVRAWCARARTHIHF